MSFFSLIKKWFWGIFKIDSTSPKSTPTVTPRRNEVAIIQEPNKLVQDDENYKLKNVLYERLNYLEQYVKSFELSHPKEFTAYMSRIDEQKNEYTQELELYKGALNGDIAFTIDPECEAKRITKIAELEQEIVDFVDFVVVYNLYKDKFSTLCSKLNYFYNALINYRIAEDQVIKQYGNATLSSQNLLDDVKKLRFFVKDSRKKEEILNHLLYCDYLLFKVAIRYNLCANLYEYKVSHSKFYTLFLEHEYDKLIFKFFAGDMEQIHKFIETRLQTFESYEYLLDSCNELQIKAHNFASEVITPSYFEDVLKLENTLEEAAKVFDIDFVINIPDAFCEISFQDSNVNKIAMSVLKLIHNEKANILLEIIDSFKITISWKELYFLCKIFELYEDVVKVASDTVFSCAKDNFLDLDRTYPQYSASYIAMHKKKLLSYKGNRKKKYVLLLSNATLSDTVISSVLSRLSLDFLIVDSSIYINHSYFNGFKNLEKAFGNYITF